MRLKAGYRNIDQKLIRKELPITIFFMNSTSAHAGLLVIACRDVFFTSSVESVTTYTITLSDDSPNECCYWHTYITVFA